MTNKGFYLIASLYFPFGSLFSLRLGRNHEYEMQTTEKKVFVLDTMGVLPYCTRTRQGTVIAVPLIILKLN